VGVDCFCEGERFYYVGVSNVRGCVPFHRESGNPESLLHYHRFIGLDFLVFSLLYALFKKNTINEIVYLTITTQKSTFLFTASYLEGRTGERPETLLSF